MNCFLNRLFRDATVDSGGPRRVLETPTGASEPLTRKHRVVLHTLRIRILLPTLSRTRRSTPLGTAPPGRAGPRCRRSKHSRAGTARCWWSTTISLIKEDDLTGDQRHGRFLRWVI
jgi:hypothetical protein